MDTSRAAESFRDLLLRHRGRTGLTQLELARRVGGRLYFLRETGNLNEIYRRIALEISAQYTLGYYPSSGTARPGWRSLRVELARGANAPPGSKLTHRGSYYVSAFQ